MKHIIVFLAGLLFSTGLMVSGMINPQKVIGFLDLLGSWDPSLAFVMAGAVAVNFFGFRLVTQKPNPLYSEKFNIPSRTDLDLELIAGACLFGVGWGLVGLCPGPAMAALSASPSKAVIFVAAMLVGMTLARAIKPSPEMATS